MLLSKNRTVICGDNSKTITIVLESSDSHFLLSQV